MDAFALIDMAAVSELIGKRRSSNFTDIEKGLLPPGVDAGPNSRRWPYGEIREIVRARIAGKSDDEIRVLVKRLIAARTESEPGTAADPFRSGPADEPATVKRGRGRPRKAQPTEPAQAA